MTEPHLSLAKERRVDTDSRMRVVELEAHYRTIAKRLTWMVAIIGATLVIVSAVIVELIHENSRRSQQIQAERALSVRESCEATNKRHDDTFKALDGIFADVLKKKGITAAERAQVEQSRSYNRLIINSLAPKRDCAAAVRNSVSKDFKEGNDHPTAVQGAISEAP